MEKINTIGKTITSLKEREFKMIVRALEARESYLIMKALDDEKNEKLYRELSEDYNRLAQFVKAQEK